MEDGRDLEVNSPEEVCVDLGEYISTEIQTKQRTVSLSENILNPSLHGCLDQTHSPPQIKGEENQSSV